ncbi:MAG: GNAT family N-acetyltransferase [Promethearchaeota archaeon]
MTDFNIANATPKDKEDLADTWQHFKDRNAMIKRAECFIIHRNAILAKKGNEIIGKSLWYVKGDPNEGVAELEELYVFEEYRNKGIGTELINSTINSVRKFFKNLRIKPRRIFLYSEEDNLNARRLYEKLGFEFIANLGHLFSDENNELLYILDLTK